jgi:arabinan endo-1,5-alpha-L-arabinosidase
VASKLAVGAGVLLGFALSLVLGGPAGLPVATAVGPQVRAAALHASPQPVRFYRNPVFDHDAPDPSVTRAADGRFYAYTTQSSYGGRLNVPVLRSADLIHWELAGDALPVLPAWATRSVWAPHIDRVHGAYHLYFAARWNVAGDFAIGLATASGPLGPFVDSGRPLLRGSGLNAIDPFVLTTPDGRRFLYWGSAGQPLRVQQMTADGLSLVGEQRPVLFPNRQARGGYERLVEGAWVMARGDVYYLFYSGDACCNRQAHYAVMVARSSSPFGPFTRDPRNPILQGNAAFLAPGHNATIEDSAGQDWIVYHAMRPNDTSDRFLMLDRLDWGRDGWPAVDGGQGPSSGLRPAPLVDPLAVIRRQSV